MRQQQEQISRQMNGFQVELNVHECYWVNGYGEGEREWISAAYLLAQKLKIYFLANIEWTKRYCILCAVYTRKREKENKTRSERGPQPNWHVQKEEKHIISLFFIEFIISICLLSINAMRLYFCCCQPPQRKLCVAVRASGPSHPFFIAVCSICLTERIICPVSLSLSLSPLNRYGWFISKYDNIFCSRYLFSLPLFPASLFRFIFLFFCCWNLTSFLFEPLLPLCRIPNSFVFLCFLLV